MPSLTLRRRRAVVPGRGITVRRSAPGPHSKVLNLGVTNLRRSTLARRTVREHSSTLVWALHRDIHVAAYAVAPIAPPTSNTKWGMRTRQRRLPLERRTVWMGPVVISGVLPQYSTTIVRTHSQQVPAEHGGRVGDVERDRVHRGGLCASRPVRARQTPSRPGLVSYSMTPMAARDGGGVPGEMLTWWPFRPRSARGARTRSRRLDVQLLTRRASGEDPAGLYDPGRGRRRPTVPSDHHEYTYRDTHSAQKLRDSSCASRWNRPWCWARPSSSLRRAATVDRSGQLLRRRAGRP